MKRSWWPVVVGAIGAMILSSCASFTVNSLPQPGGVYRGGYDIVMEFSNVLNLPDRAKVVMDGTTIGVVTNVSIVGGQVDVTSQISRQITVPSDVHATLQQATVLGDIYVALERSTSADPMVEPLGPDGRIPLAQTTSPPQLEDTMASLANFVASGSIQRVQNTVIGVNNVTPSGAGEVRKLASRFAIDFSDLAENIDLVDQWLDGVAGTVRVMHDNLGEFQQWFSPEGMLGFDRGLVVTTYIGILLPSVGSIYHGGYWLVPMLDSVAETMGLVQQSKWNVEEEVPAWRDLFTDFFLPEDKFPAINITSIEGPDGREMIDSVQDVLRILGATP